MSPALEGRFFFFFPKTILIFLNDFIYCIYFWLRWVGHHFCVGFSLVVVQGLLTEVVSFAVEHTPQPRPSVAPQKSS